MVGVEKQDSLRFIRRLVDSAFVQIDLWQNDRGDLFILLPVNEGHETIVLPTTENLLVAFCANELTVQGLVTLSPSPFVQLIVEEQVSTIYLPDADVVMPLGHATYQQLMTELGEGECL